MDEKPYRCELCWTEFDTEAELADHMRVEENTLYVVGGENVVVDIEPQEPST